MSVVDLNSDLGESYGNWRLGDDSAMLAIVSSANIACGFHAGDPSTLRAACAGAATNGVAIGAQVSFPDLLGFGRRHIDMTTQELRDAVLYQIAALDGFARAAGSRVTYVKPHGALYHAAASDERCAHAVAAAAHEYDDRLKMLSLPNSELLQAATARGLEPVGEAFADRAYRPDGGLISRREPNSVLSDPDVIARRVVQLAVDQSVVAVDGSTINVAARSLCVHGDTPGAVAIASAVRHALDRAGVDIEAFA